MAQLIAEGAFTQELLTLQLYYKSFGILLRSERVYIALKGP